MNTKPGQMRHRIEKIQSKVTFSLILAVLLPSLASIPKLANAEGREMELRYAEEELAKAENEFHIQLKKLKDPKPEEIEQLKKEILEPKREALGKVMGDHSKPGAADGSSQPPKGAQSGSDIMSGGPVLDGAKVEKTMSFPGKKKAGSDLKKTTPKAVQFKEESAQGSYGSDQIQFDSKKSK